MRVFYKEGFLLFKSEKPGPVFIAPHATMSLLSIVRGDVCTELITARLVKKMGGIGVVSTVPRKGKYGIDYFRWPATMKEATAMFKMENDYEARYKFEKKYSFFARDEEEYLEKASTYNQFWTTVETLAPNNPLFVLVHAQGTRLKNFPSLLDLATLSGKWMDEKKVIETIEKVNRKYNFERYKDDLKYYALAWARMCLKRAIEYRFGSFDLKKIKGSFRVALEDDIEKAASLLGRDKKELLKNFTFQKYLLLIEEVIDSKEFGITYQNAFDGQPGEERVKKLLDKCGGQAILVEASTFLNEMYPDVSVKLIKDVIEEIIRKDKLRIFNQFLK